MSTTFNQRIGAAFRHRKVQFGATVGLALIALGSVGVIAVTAAARPEPPSAELAERARLAIEVQPVRENRAMVPHGQLSTLDPEQENRVRDVAYPQPVDPQLVAMLHQEAREQAQVQAEQRAFEARLRGEMSDRPQVATDDQPPPREPAQPHYSTSNSEDIGDNAPGA